MNPLTDLRRTILLIPSAVVLACFGLLPIAQAVVPPPDGGYPNFTTAEGTNALLNLTSGAANTAVGWYSLFSAGAANNNTGVGAGALALNTADSNTAVGTAAMFLNTGGAFNVAVGTAALLNNATGDWNSAIGAFALHDNIDGFNNNALGQAALFRNIHGTDNTAVGDSALLNNDITGNGDANFNTAVGSAALFSNTDGQSNTAVGYFALRDNTTANFNTATGFQALASNTTGESNTATGSSALFNNITGFQNTAIGAVALFNNTSGVNNTAIGTEALSANTEGGANTANGFEALSANTTGQFNTALGFLAGSAVSTADNVIAIGANVVGANVSNSCYIGSIFGQTSSSGIAVFINSDGKLGTTTSSRRFKDEIKPMDQASEALFALKPVTFRYKKELDSNRIPQFGLIAEEVERVNPDLVARDREGKPYTVRYEAVNAMLLNEFLKEHRKVQELEANDADQQRDIKALVATVKEQAAQIQRVSAQLAMSRPAPQTVVNNP